MRLPNICNQPVKIRVIYLSLISYMARIDQTIDDEELRHLTTLSQRFSIPAKYQGQIFTDIALSPTEVESGFTELAERKLHYSFFLDLVVMAMADGVLMEEERIMLAQIQRLIQIPSVDMHNLLTFAQTTIGLDINVMVDPMYSYVIDNFFNWAGQSHVRLFKQTSFSINPKTDEYLKAQLGS